MDEESTLTRVCYLLSGIVRRISDKPLDKASDMRFIKLKPEQCAETERIADQRPSTRYGEMENVCVTKTLSPSTSSPALLPRS